MSRQFPLTKSLPAASEQPQHATRRRRRQLMWIARGGALLFLLLAIFLIYLALNLGIAYAAAQNFRQLKTDPRAAEEKLQTIHRSLGRVNGAMLLVRPVSSWLTFIPWVGPTLASAPQLAQIGYDLSSLAEQALPVTLPLLNNASNPSLPSLLPTLTGELQGYTPQWTAELAALNQQIDALPVETLLPIVRSAVSDLHILVILAHGTLALGTTMPDLVGLDGEMRTYLVLAQNNHELRGTGGFITSIGTLTLLDGEIIGFDFQDSYAWEEFNDQATTAPLPMQRYMNLDRLVLRDVNWSPDLPTTARVAQALYAGYTGLVVDGVITVDLQAAGLLVGALEPLAIPGLEEPVTGQTFVEQAKQLWAAPAQTDANLATDVGEWWERRKDFIPLIAGAALARVEQGAVDPLRLARAVGNALEARAIQVWLPQPEAAAVLASLHWDGGLQPPADKDYLALVDTNFGYNKVDAVVRRTLDYQVTWPPESTDGALATAIITYQHPLKLPQAVCDPTPRYDLTYDDMIARCYFDFVRLYVPAGSRLISITGVEPDSILHEPGEVAAQVFGGYFVLRPGEEKQITIQYQLPASLRPDTYGLVVQRQAGSAQLPLRAKIGESTVETTVTQGWWSWQPSP